MYVVPFSLLSSRPAEFYIHPFLSQWFQVLPTGNEYAFTLFSMARVKLMIPYRGRSRCSPTGFQVLNVGQRDCLECIRSEVSYRRKGV